MKARGKGLTLISKGPGETKVEKRSHEFKIQEMSRSREAECEVTLSRELGVEAVSRAWFILCMTVE